MAPFVVVANFVDSANSGKILVCTQDGYQWISAQTQKNDKGSLPSKNPSCPLCLTQLELLGFDFIQPAKSLLIVKKQTLDIYQDKLNNDFLGLYNDVFLEDKRSRAPPKLFYS